MARLNDTRAIQREMPGGGRRAGLNVSGGEMILNSRRRSDAQEGFGTDSWGRIESDRRRNAAGQEDLSGAQDELQKPSLCR